LVIGAVNSTLDASFLGLIDEVSIYDRALAPGEVQSLFAAGSAGKCILQPGCVSIPAGLVSWWQAEGNANDAADSNMGVVVNGASFAPGEVGQAFNFGGTNHVEVPASSNLNVQSLTIEAWIFPADVSLLKPILEFGAPAGSAGLHLWHSVGADGNLAPGSLYANVGDAFGPYKLATSAGAIPSNQWSHVALTYDQISGIARLLVNGTTLASTNFGSITPATSLPLNIGYRPWVGGTHFVGRIDELGIYNRALAVAEIQALFAAGSAGKCVPSPDCVPIPPGSISWWPGNGNGNDLAGTNHATLTAGISFTNGMVGQGFGFNGIDSQIRFGNSVGNFDTNDFTIDFWIRTTSTRHESVIEKWPTCGVASMWTIRIGGTGPGKLESEMFSDALGNDHYSMVSDRAINDGFFHHVAFVRGGTNVVFYVDGVLDVAKGALSGSVSRINNTADLVVGRSICVGVDGTFPFTGQLDELSIYHRALSADEIQTVFNARSAGKCVPTVPPQPAGPFVNGGFESPVFSPGGHSLPSGSISVIGWKTGLAGIVSIVNGAVTGGVNPADGVQQIVFNSGDTAPGANLSQTFDTLIGQTYTVRFYIGRGGSGPGTMSLLAEAKSGTEAVLGSLAALAPSAPGYGAVQTFNFTATTTNSTLAFTDTSTATTAVDVLLDNVTVSAIGNCDPSPAGLVSWWQAESNANDSADGNNGVLANGVSFAAGKVGQAFSLEGVDDFVSFADSPSLRLTNLTIEGWFNFAAVGGPRILVAKTAGTVYESYLLFANGGDIMAGVGDTTAGVTTLLQFNLNPVLGTWYHIAYTFDDAANYHALYIDGVLRASGANNTTIGYDTHPVMVGAEFENEAANFFFAGQIDEVSIYNRALTVSEIQAVFNAGSDGKCPPQPVLSLTISPAAGFYTNAVTVAIGAVNAGTNAVVHYTLDGSPPSTNSPVYSAAFSVTNTATVSARAFVNGAPASEMIASTFRFWSGSSGCVAPPGAISWWTGDGTTDDVLGLNPGVVVGEATFAPGFIGQAFSFGAEGDAITVANSASLQLQTFTIEAWAKRQSTNQASLGVYGNGTFFAYGSGGYAFGIFDDGRLLLTRVGVSYVASTTTVTDTNWHHVTVTKSGTNVSFYVDGVRGGNTNYNTTFTFGSNAAIGATGDNLAASFYGLIDELAIYGRALSTNEVQILFSAGANGKCPAFGPTIITQPQSRTFSVGGNASFSVLSGGSPPLSYQWSFNGTAITNATNQAFALANAQSTNAGNYTVTVSNAFGSVTSLPASLILNSPPVITQQPKSQTVMAGSAATFTVGVTGSPTLIYQWRRNGGLVPGASSPTIVINNVQAQNAGSYTVRISNFFGQVTSQPAILTVASGHFSVVSVGANGVLLSVEGEAGGNYTIEVSSDLGDPANWQPLATLLNNPLNWQFTDTTAPGISQRFYRLLKSP
jgi:hypothetical protein